MNVATAPREHLKINARKVHAHGLLGIQKILGTMKKTRQNHLQHFHFFPVVKNETTLADLVNRISWYLPESEYSQVDIQIPVQPDLLNTSLESLLPPYEQENCIGKSKSISLINGNSLDLSNADAILVWDKKGLLDHRLLLSSHKVHIVDPNYYYTFESYNYSRLHSETLSREQNQALLDISKSNYSALLGKVNGLRKGYAFATGPSLEKATEFDFSDGFCVICNTIVKNQSLLHHIKPDLLVFLDEALFFGVSRYGEEFRKMMMKTVETFKCYVMIPEHMMSLLLAHFPQLKDYVIGIRSPGIREMSPGEIGRMLIRRPWDLMSFAPKIDNIPGQKERYNFPTPDKLYVKRSTSVLTMCIIPVISSVCNEIYVIGADGRKPDENYFWSHNASAQFGDIMQTLFDTHPSFFRDAPYTDMYQQYCRYFKELIEYGESMGKNYYSLTPSYIPALASRPAHF